MHAVRTTLLVVEFQRGIGSRREHLGWCRTDGVVTGPAMRAILGFVARPVYTLVAGDAARCLEG